MRERELNFNETRQFSFFLFYQFFSFPQTSEEANFNNGKNAICGFRTQIPLMRDRCVVVVDDVAVANVVVSEISISHF
jgi:hypothetical protein